VSVRADEAAKLSTQSLTGPVIDPLLEHIFEKIRQAATEGKRSITHPFQELPVGDWPRRDVQEAVWKTLRDLGYTVKRHDPGPSPDPRETAWDEVSW
jgi:hypothetical protein